jgi:hypothetical protein
MSLQNLMDYLGMLIELAIAGVLTIMVIIISGFVIHKFIGWLEDL